MTITTTFVALNGVAAAAATAGSGLGAIARNMSRLAAVVAVAATSTTASTLGAVPRHMTLLIAIVASHGSAATISTAATTLTRL